MKKKIGFSSFPDFSGNSKALYQDISKDNNKYEFVWFCKNKIVANRLNEKGIKAIWDKSENFVEEFNKTDIIVITHDDYWELKRDNQIFINLWHGVGPKKGGNLIDGEEEWKYKFSTKNDYLISTSELGRIIFSSEFNIPLSRVKQFPQARYKWIFESNGRKNLEKVLKKDLKKYKKIIMYTPTFKNGLGREETKINKSNLLNLNIYDEEMLINYIEENDFLLVLKLHPSEENKIMKTNSENIVVLQDERMLEEFITINEILNGIDLLISDYSSIYVDYMNLERPVIFLDTDKDEYQKNRGIIFDSLDFWWVAGPKVHTIEKFIEETEKLFNDSLYYKKERTKFNKLVNGQDRKNNKKLINFINNIEKAYILENENIQLKNKIEELYENNKILEQDLKDTRKDLDIIKYSRSYKIISKIRKIIKKGDIDEQ